MPNKPPPCRCPLHAYPHRHSLACPYYTPIKPGTYWNTGRKQ